MEKLIKTKSCFSIFLLIVTTLLFFSSSILAQSKKAKQKTKSFSPCTLEIKDSPKIRDVYLRMPKNKFLEMFPSAELVENLSDSEIGNLRYDVNSSENSNFADGDAEITFVWFVDDELASIGFQYPKFEPVGIKDFVRQASEKFKLPLNSWQNTDGMTNPQTLQCKEFEVMIGSEVFRAGQGNPYMILSDKVADEKIAARRKEIQTKKKEELLRKEKEKRVFKP